MEGGKVDDEISVKPLLPVGINAGTKLARIGFKVFSVGGPEVQFHGVELVDKGGFCVYKSIWCDLGNWKYQEIGENETVVGFHGQILNNKDIIRIGLVTV